MNFASAVSRMSRNQAVGRVVADFASFAPGTKGTLSHAWEQQGRQYQLSSLISSRGTRFEADTTQSTRSTLASAFQDRSAASVGRYHSRTRQNTDHYASERDDDESVSGHSRSALSSVLWRAAEAYRSLAPAASSIHASQVTSSCHSRGSGTLYSPSPSGLSSPTGSCRSSCLCPLHLPTNSICGVSSYLASPTMSPSRFDVSERYTSPTSSHSPTPGTTVWSPSLASVWEPDITRDSASAEIDSEVSSNQYSTPPPSFSISISAPDYSTNADGSTALS